MRKVTLTMLLITLLAGGQTEAGIVKRRDQLAEVKGPIVAIDDAGVTLRVEGRVVLVVWDRIREVQPDEPVPFLNERLDFAQDLWRARRRVGRGDTKLAEPIFERLFEQVRGRTNEASLIIAEGLLRCHLMRGANEAAVLPYLEMARLRRAGITTDRYAMLKSVYDDEFSLCPQLAPYWADAESIKRLGDDLQSYDPGDDPVIAAIRGLFLQFSTGKLNPDAGDSPRLPRHRGVDLLRRLLGAASGDSVKRLMGRKRLLRELTNHSGWAEAWIRYQIGASFLKENTPEAHQHGLVSLAHLPARYSSSQPYLAGMALWRIAEQIEAEDGQPAAASLRSELLRQYPGHPILFTSEMKATIPEKTKESL